MMLDIMSGKTPQVRPEMLMFMRLRMVQTGAENVTGDKNNGTFNEIIVKKDIYISTSPLP